MVPKLGEASASYPYLSAPRSHHIIRRAPRTLHWEHAWHPILRTLSVSTTYVHFHPYIEAPPTADPESDRPIDGWKYALGKAEASGFRYLENIFFALKRTLPLQKVTFCRPKLKPLPWGSSPVDTPCYSRTAGPQPWSHPRNSRSPLSRPRHPSRPPNQILQSPLK